MKKDSFSANDVSEYRINFMGGNSFLNKVVQKKFGGVLLSKHCFDKNKLSQEYIKENADEVRKYFSVKRTNIKRLQLDFCLTPFLFFSNTVLTFLETIQNSAKIYLNFESCVFDSEVDFKHLFEEIYSIRSKYSEINYQLIQNKNYFYSAPLLKTIWYLNTKLLDEFNFYFSDPKIFFPSSFKLKKNNDVLCLIKESSINIPFEQNIKLRISKESIILAKGLNNSFLYMKNLTLVFHLFKSLSIRSVSSVLDKLFNSTSLTIENLVLEVFGSANPVEKLLIDLVSRKGVLENKLNIIDTAPLSKHFLRTLFPFVCKSEKLCSFHEEKIIPENYKKIKNMVK
eukprot:snap_masked-scaffold_44-processed-gene-1.58-mRNA-1 protein AED:1.00 eAED:1.00 QI:0/0/0/0/1/1/2/0/340